MRTLGLVPRLGLGRSVDPRGDRHRGEPGLLGLGVPQGPIEGIIGARVNPKGHVEVAGYKKGWVERQAVAVLRKFISLHGLLRPLPIVVIRGDEPGPSMSGPLRKGGSRVGSIMFDGQTATLIIGTSCRQIAA